MTNFKTITDLPIFDNLNDCFEKMLSKNLLTINDHNQICINAPKGKEDDYLLGAGSLYFDWMKIKTKDLQADNKPPVREKVYEESDFTELCTVFKNTPFEIIYNALKEKYRIGRVRLMISSPKTCLSWHTDTSPRLHFPIKTQEGCFMVIEDEVLHLPKNQWTLTNTTLKHTAFNASFEKRIHIVASILENYES